jgi:signal transduction histidine kinase
MTPTALQKKKNNQNNHFKRSLKVRVALGIALPALISLSAFSLVRYSYERQIMEDQLALTAVQVGEMAVASLRHAMLEDNAEHLNTSMQDVNRAASVLEIQVVDMEGLVAAASTQENVGEMRSPEESGCVECHDPSIIDPPRITHLHSDDDVLRVSAPIDNEPDCATCHTQEEDHLGVLLVDVSLDEIADSLSRALTLDLVSSLASTALITGGMFWLVNLLVVRRVELMKQPIEHFAEGQFESRLPVVSPPTDELDLLGATFNTMADTLQEHERQQAERQEVRQRAIIEERERIAREMHDGLAQLLGYVNTKAMAVRLALKKDNALLAQQNLKQLEEASRELFTDVRESILGLKTTSSTDLSLHKIIADYANQYHSMSGIKVDMTMSEEISNIALPAEAELQLFRIIQEALTNVRKHAQSENAWIDLSISNGYLHVTVGDQGVGFNPAKSPSGRGPHFGLAIMRERAQSINAELNIDSEPGGGTRVEVIISLGAAQ